MEDRDWLVEPEFPETDGVTVFEGVPDVVGD